MYDPKYSLSHSLVNNLIKFEVDRHLFEDKEMRDNSKDVLNARTKALNLLHLGHIIGVNLTLKDAEKLAEGKRIETEDLRGIILNNYRNVIEFIRSSATDTYVEIDLNVLVHLNRLLVMDWKQSWEAKFRIGGESIDVAFDNWVDYHDRTIQPVNIQEELNELIDWYKSKISKINPLIRIGIFIYRLVRIYPFIALNKLTIMAITDYLLHKNGYLNSTFIPTARVFDTFDEEFIDSWNNAIQGSLNPETNQVEKVDDMTLWIERFVRNLAGDMQDTKDLMQRQVIEEERSVKQPFLDLNKRQLKILKYLQTIPTVKREDYVQMMNVSTMTAYRDINELVDKKLLKTNGRGRGTKYMLKSR